MAKARLGLDEARIDAIFEEVNQTSLGGCTVGVAVGGVPIYRKGFGLANMELPLVLTPATRLRLGSITKQFTAFAYLLLCEDGLAGIDDEVGRFLPHLGASARAVTARQLMGNISGLREATDLISQFGGPLGRAGQDEVVGVYRDVESTNAAPLATYNYNNGGWVVLSAVIEAVAGAPLEQVMRERIFEPLDMRDTALRRLDEVFEPNSAACHRLMETGEYRKIEFMGGRDFSGAGAMVSTVDDMLRWMAHMDAPRLGSAATWAGMKTPQVLSNGRRTHYGMGVITGEYRGLQTIGHGGGGYSANATMVKVPALGLDVVVLVNRSDVSAPALGERILDLCVGEAPPRSGWDGGAVAEGLYRSPASGRVIRLFEGDDPYHGARAVQMARVDGHLLPLRRDEDGALVTFGDLSSIDYRLRLEGPAARPGAVVLEDFGAADRFEPVPAGAEGGWTAAAGRFVSAELGAELQLRPGPGASLEMVSTSPFGASRHLLEPLSSWIFETTPADEFTVPRGAVISFSEDWGVLSFSDLLNRDVRFERAG